ncbi:hypothetical protein H257_07540 [Aphanomyces astaci]|uniref:Cyclic nucleotide-binding domain-containing protein n=2 Tax=Aphanomyces astaci TaxID=112090 RepID=W4GHC3_APHAT|nr:hypothetical protein H257_07540 [Aphanomyces astaci]ETV78686.1 hypothetical protein H257_07540 [Aphanomyces astaci]|eukprot:XP_009831405.1 hypothetical protein H257_07540 [Aphanomyces astaci]
MPAIQPVPTFATVGPMSPSATMTRVQPVKPRRPIPKFQTSMSLSAQFLNRITRSPSKSPFISTTASIRHHAWFRAIHPHSAMMKNWDVLSIALIVFTAVVTPFETAFAVATVDSFLFVLNRIVDICFFADAILHFFVMYYDEANSVWVSDRRKITWKYLTGWFLLDLISMLPFDVVGLAVDNNTVKQLRFTRVLRLLRLMKILKVLRGANNFRIWESKMSINYATIALVKFCLLVFMSSHWMACIFRMVVDIEEFVDPLGFKFNWMTEHTMGSIPISKSSLGIQYMSALYWSVMTLTTIGYGDLVPTTPGERSLAITCMLIGGGTYAYVVGSVCQILNSMDASTTEFHQTIDTLNEYCHHNQLPSELSARLREYFHSSRTLLRERQHHNLLLTMSPGLRGEVALYNNQWIAKIEFFNCSNDFERNQFITAVALLLRHECFPPNEYVIREGEFNTKMYLVQRGLATKGKVMYTGGTFFGEDIILTLRQRKIAVRAFSYLHVQALSKFELEELIYSGLYPEIQRNIRRQVLKTAFKNNFVKLSQDTIRRRNSNHRMRNSVSSNMPPMMSPMLRSTLGLNVPIGFYHDFLPKQSPPPAKLEKDNDTVDNIVEGVSNLMDANIAKFDEGLTKKIDQVLAQLERLEKYVAPNVIFSPAPAKTSTPPSTSPLERQNSTAYLEAVQQLERGEIRSLVRANSNRRRSSLPSQIY